MWQLEQISAPQFIGARGLDRECSFAAIPRREVFRLEKGIDGLLAEFNADDRMPVHRQPLHVTALAAKGHENAAPGFGRNPGPELFKGRMHLISMEADVICLPALEPELWFHGL